MTLGIVRRGATPPKPHAQQLDPKPGAEQLIEELEQLQNLKDAGVLSESEYARQRAHILSDLV